MDQSIRDHEDILAALNRKRPLQTKLLDVHGLLKTRFPFINRISIALYDHKTDLLKTFTHSSDDAVPLAHYQSKLAESDSLRSIVESGRARVVNDLLELQHTDHQAANHLLKEGYRASYTMPMHHNEELLGFLFFNSFESDVFTTDVLRDLDVFGHLLALLVNNELALFYTLQASVKTAQSLAHRRDFETGTHLDRMANFCRLIGNELAKQEQLSDEWVEHLFLFAPLPRYRQDRHSGPHPVETYGFNRRRIRDHEDPHYRRPRDHQ